MTFSFHVHRQIVLQVAKCIAAQNKTFVNYIVTLAPQIPTFDGNILPHSAQGIQQPLYFSMTRWRCDSNSRGLVQYKDANLPV